MLVLALGLMSASAQEKYIKLRNGRISTPEAKRVTTQSLVAETPVSGLYLVQFNGPVGAVERQQMQAAGVELVRYVPDDAFIARLSAVRLSDLRALGSVRWVGQYEAGFKLDQRLRLNRGALLNAPLAVRILLTPKATPVELAAVRNSVTKFQGGAVSRFGVIASATATPAQLANLANSPAVLWIEAAPKMHLFDEVASKIVAGDDGVSGTFATVHQMGYDGSGSVVAVADTGLNNGDKETMHPDLAGRVDSFMWYGALADAADEHSHGTHVAGIVAGNGATGEIDENGALYGIGVAPGAHIIAQRIFDGAGNYEGPPPGQYETLTRNATEAGAEIGSNSWGDDTQGRYDLSAAEFDGLVRDADYLLPGDQPYILEFSAGNAGPGEQTIGSPAVAKNVIATGASENNRFDFIIYSDGEDGMADFSSRGPCEDGRIKPDVVAPGTWIASLQSQSASDQYAWAAISPNYQYQGGTSQAGPHASGAAAVFVQYYRQAITNRMPSPAMVKAALINSAVDMDDSFGTGPTPNNDEGWGRIDLTQIISATRRLDCVDQTVPLTTGQKYERRVVVANSDEPLKVTLAYTDFPGLPAAIPALVNDLDLQVISPAGRVYRGNQFDDTGESVPDAPTSDSLNNIEGVYISAPAPGEYIIRVTARNVVEDSLQDTPAIDQDFALVASAEIPLPSQAILFFDRPAYRVPATVNVRLIDRQLSLSTVNVTLSSTTQTSPVTLTLRSDGGVGSYTGSVFTANAPAIADGKLHIADGDAMTAQFQDPNSAQPVVASAIADLHPPIISGVTATNQFGKEIITWNTDESASSVFYYGTNQTPSIAITNTVPLTDSEVDLAQLVNGKTYKYMIVAIDRAGNMTTNNNGGAYFSFVAAAARQVLLVEAYTQDHDYDTQNIPVTSYTSLFDQIGLTYDVWPTASRGFPTTNDMAPFRAVVWRLNDNPVSGDTIAVSQQNALQAYINSGGAFFISSMELLTRLGDVPFRTNVLHMQSFREDVGVETALGVGGSAISSSMTLPLDYTIYDSFILQFLGQSPDVADTFNLTANASPVFYDADTGNFAGSGYPRPGQDSTGRVVFLSFPLDAISTSSADPNNRLSVMRNIMGFLLPGANGVGSVALDSPAYSLPSQITIEVADSDLAGTGTTTVSVINQTFSNSVVVTLSETVHAGDFRGVVTVVSATNAPQAGLLRARNGDQLRVDYFDASAHSTVSANALVDTVAPIVSGIDVEPQYSDATVSWVTSEPTDALVQYGESPLLGRTAYSGELSTVHALDLVALASDHKYYYRVVSTDNAGNTASSDIFTFTTLRPVSLPFTDNFETGATNWTTYGSDDSESSWTLGVPHNGIETAAHSPVNAWGSCLHGGNFDQVDTFLISPAIDLTGGNQATLKFWHSYDFTEQSDVDILQGGELLIFTNETGSATTLAEYFDSSDGWSDETIDLTPYMGNVVFIAWHHQLLSLEFAERPGWLVDDVSIVSTTNVLGSIAVTNNLAQARYSISGPSTRSGQGSGVFTDLLPGAYQITWAAVPYYLTPAPASGNLVGGSTLNFAGNYTMVDANSNGLPDAWEQLYFGTNASVTKTGDPDGDGMNNYAEFVAGTNPTNAFSVLRVRIAPPVNDRGTLTVSTVPSHSYRLWGSTNAVNWAPLTDLQYSPGSSMTFSWTNNVGNRDQLFRVEVRQ